MMRVFLIAACALAAVLAPSGASAQQASYDSGVRYTESFEERIGVADDNTVVVTATRPLKEERIEWPKSGINTEEIVDDSWGEGRVTRRVRIVGIGRGSVNLTTTRTPDQIGVPTGAPNQDNSVPRLGLVIPF